jgi:GH25 family lysozyme M1 (1,4-beta-N-acetylmuramidase)
MNATHNHTMGSTIPRESAPKVQAKTRSFAVQAAASGQPPGTPGLDVSGYQTLTRADWNNVFANGARFAYVKATEGTDYVSSQFAEQYNDSSAAGLVRGAYHFATPNTSSGAAQANYFVSNGGGWSADGKTLPPMLDIEYNPYGETCYGMAGAAMVAWIRDFSNTVLARTGRLPAIYSTTDWWTRCTGNTAAFSANPLFIARYTTSGSVGTLPAGWSTYTFWQWWDAGFFPGDQDVFNGNVSQLITTASTQNAWRPSPVITA